MNVRRLLVPHFKIRTVPGMLAIAVIGSLTAGVYGILHDQVTYTISPEYFTKLKYLQFDYLNPNHPDRVRVGQIGFLATSGVGLFAGWFMARVALPRHPFKQALKVCLQGFVLMFGCTLLAGFIGFALGEMHGPDYSKWQSFHTYLGVQNLPDFVQVGYIHNAGYIGALAGLIVACIYLKRKRPDTDRS